MSMVDHGDDIAWFEKMLSGIHETMHKDLVLKQ